MGRASQGAVMALVQRRGLPAIRSSGRLVALSRRSGMKIRIITLGAAAMALCSSSIAIAAEAVRATQARPISKTALRISRAAPNLHDANKDGATIPIVLGAAVGLGALVYLATKQDSTARRKASAFDRTSARRTGRR